LGSIKQLSSGYYRLADFAEAATEYVKFNVYWCSDYFLSAPITVANSFGNDIPSIFEAGNEISLTFANSFYNDISFNNIQTLN